MSCFNSNELIARIIAPSFGKDFIGVVVDAKDKNVINKKVFIPYVLVGELVRVKVLKDSKNFLRGEVLEIVEASPFRVEPKCPSFYRCGGCHYQHIEYSQQLEYKKKVVSDFLLFQSKILSSDSVDDNIKDGGIKVLGDSNLSSFYYRKRAVIHILENGKMGFFENGTHSVVDFDECALLSRELLECYKILKPIISKYGKYFYSLTLDIEGSDIYVILSIRDESLLKELRFNNYFKIYEDLPYKFIFKYRGQDVFKTFSHEDSAGSFSQVNIEANKFLVDFVIKEVSEISSKQGILNSITELYAGAGNFTFLLSDYANRVDAVELDGELVKKGISLSLSKGLEGKVNFIQSSCEKYVKKNKLGALVLLDPPRGGAKEVVKYINLKDTKSIVYISCYLPTFQRDLKALLSKGYKMTALALLDMFPNTHHVECVALLQREIM
ncbi:MAG: class I SAM-dependent RNA methyltransferase [Bdellovibrionota bacterium]